MNDELRVEYCGVWHAVTPGGRFTIGRSGDLAIDDNPYLHRTFLELRHDSGVWVVANVGRALTATVGDPENRFVAHLAPGGVLPLAFGQSRVRFGAGPTTYELTLVLPEAPFEPVPPREDDDDLDVTTRGPVTLTPDQRRLVVALAENELRRTGSGPSTLPTTAEAAMRCGWTEKKFHKKLDGLCQKLDRAGIRGLHGSPGDLATNRRARLVEYCLSTSLVTAHDLAVFEGPTG